MHFSTFSVMCILIALVIYPVCFAAELNLGKFWDLLIQGTFCSDFYSNWVSVWCSLFLLWSSFCIHWVTLQGLEFLWWKFWKSLNLVAFSRCKRARTLLVSCKDVIRVYGTQSVERTVLYERTPSERNRTVKTQLKWFHIVCWRGWKLTLFTVNIFVQNLWPWWADV